MSNPFPIAVFDDAHYHKAHIWTNQRFSPHSSESQTISKWRGDCKSEGSNHIPLGILAKTKEKFGHFDSMIV